MSGPVRLIVCVNRRLGSGQRSCAGSGSVDLITKLETLFASENLDVPIIRRECLGRCQQGPAMRIAPGGPFFCETNASSLGEIVSQLKVFIAEHNA